MSNFFTALNPRSSNSGTRFSSDIAEDTPDLTVSLMLSLIWKQDLSVLEGIYETFNLFYGDHYDESDMHYGRKGLLDFSILPLLSRKLIADTYLKHRENAWFLNSLAWMLAIPIEVGRLLLALSFTIVLAPVVLVVTALRAFGHWAFAPKNKKDEKVPPMTMPLPLAMAALIQIQRALIHVNLCTKENLRLFLKKKESLKLTYVIEHLAYTKDKQGKPQLSQQLLEYLLRNRKKFTDPKHIEKDGSLKAGEAKILLENFIAAREPKQTTVTHSPSQEELHPKTPTLAALRLHWLVYTRTVGETIRYSTFREEYKPELLEELEKEFRTLYPKVERSLTHHPALVRLIEDEMQRMLAEDLLEADPYDYTLDAYPI